MYFPPVRNLENTFDFGSERAASLEPNHRPLSCHQFPVPSLRGLIITRVEASKHYASLLFRSILRLHHSLKANRS